MTPSRLPQPTLRSVRSRTLAVLAALLVPALAACPGLGDPLADDGGSDDTAAPASTSDGGSTSDAVDDTGTGADTSGGATDDAALELLERLPGLWIAPVMSWTSVGDFPLMAMDIRPADDRTLFSRVDLDTDNNLRFAFTVEEHDGVPTLIYRNGGYFLGLLRDTRTALVDHDPETNTWTMCAISGGCGYVEAIIHMPADDVLELSANVFGRPHMHWQGMRAEERPLDGPFPYDPAPGASDDPFPPMPTLRATLSWTEPLTEATDAWLVLSTTDCGLVPGTCSPSRFIRATAPAGATSVELVIDQIHADAYSGNAILDRNGNLGAGLFPDAGDLVSLPNRAVDVADVGESTVSISLLVEI